eukprot:CAMPEP_0119501326 /NCGR_PEP_ID=MMETSP1344-20130328/23195_1 /TAXON_ID=236787 /ORGANISM="Florenciella parvula, Strain CCMP2471" /LENGTH=67 /DNA_ID=CAMNT_0007537483 /DNA_START=25 /DNA_END=228 /DNA_ORIENTATION=+
MTSRQKRMLSSVDVCRFTAALSTSSNGWCCRVAFATAHGAEKSKKVMAVIMRVAIITGQRRPTSTIS